ncbi:hypothetical protein [Nostoc sp. UHCC 0870]|uniref:hypothetical protein n=1 Tax=Nostoc sp. UHCC 0870 TaxID=2914041 RepID=UPI001EDF60D4|nr:hypothetical protein [Nostoc sp. UHCC 0870]UKP00996.1 hypothetical protein L6494_27990 [Nostoc sp. UHCC 0870]
MEIKTISVTYQRKFNLGDYESVEVGCSLWGQIDPEEDAEGATQFLFEQAKESVKKAAMPLLKASQYQMNKYKQSAKQINNDNLENF